MKVQSISVASEEEVEYSSILTILASQNSKPCSLGVGANNFLGVKRVFCPNFPIFARKTFKWQNFPLQIFCSYWYIIYSSTPSRHRLRKTENLILEIWFCVTQLKQSTLGCAVCKDIVNYQLALYFEQPPHRLTLLRFGVAFTIQLLLSAINLRPSWGRPKAASFSEDIYVICVACIILFYVMTMPWDPTTVSVQPNINPTCNKVYGKMC